MKIYLSLDAESNVKGWGGNLANAPSVDIATDHDFFTNFQAYKFVDGQLVFSEENANKPQPKSEIEQLTERLTLSEDAIDFLLMNGGLS